MTRDEIICMAREAGFTVGYGSPALEKHERFAQLVAAAEREACAKWIEDSWMAFSRSPNLRLDLTPFPELSYVAKIIRARGEK
jgi:hypothetical protein